MFRLTLTEYDPASSTLLARSQTVEAQDGDHTHEFALLLMEIMLLRERHRKAENPQVRQQLQKLLAQCLLQVPELVHELNERLLGLQDFIQNTAPIPPEQP